MSNPFVLIYKLFENRKSLFFFFLFLLTVGIIFLSWQLTLKQDISAFIPKDERAKKYQETIKNLKVNDRLVVNVFLKDTSKTDPDFLANYIQVLADSISERFDSTWVKELKYKIDDEAAGVFDLLYSELPYYLDQEDYSKIENSLTDSAIYNKVKSNYETIISPEGTVLKDYIVKDPLGLNKYALNKLAKLQSDEKFELYNGYLSTKDHKNFIIYLSTAYPSNDSEKNEKLVNGLSQIISKLDTSEYKAVKAEYFGTPAVSVSNVKQIKKDTFLTTGIALVLIFAGLLIYFKNFKTILLIFLPVAFGGGFALALVYLIRSEISAIAIGAGSIVLGIAINYSLHYFTHLKHERSVVKTIADLTLPLTLGCTTTVGAFFCLHFMQSEALQDMGLFAGLSLLGAAFCCLIILPPLSKSYEIQKEEKDKPSLLDKFTSYAYHKNKFLLPLVLVLTVLFAFTYSKVDFETDMTKLSYVSPELETAENNLNTITDYKLKSIFLLSQGKTLEEALNLNASAIPVIDKLEGEKTIKKYSNIGEILLTDSLRKVKINQWKVFWTPEKIRSLEEKLHKYGNQFNFNSKAFEPLLSLLTKEFDPGNDSSANELKKIFLQEYINETSNGISVITTLKVEQDSKSKVYEAFKNYEDVFILDRGSMAAMFAKILNEDFNLILALSASLVFIFIFLSYGRLELAILAFLPMIISWIWILGIMGISDFKFNIVNIIICTFIFGLGDDFSIFTIDGLEQEYKYGKNVLASYRNSIFLSAYTTIVGIGVLIFAKHPALKSIALITIIGIVCIVFVSMIIQPFLYDLFVLSRKRKGKLPVTIYSLLYAKLIFFYFITGVVVIKISGLFNSKNGINTLSLKFLNSIIAFTLFTERKLGEDIMRDFIRKNIHWINGGTIELYNQIYSSKKSIIESTSYFRGKLIKNYVFKGPVLEWYTRIKISLEDNYKIFNELIPTKGKIVDVGCGYGYLSYMLSLTAPEREIVGIDYDEEKIEIAKNGILRTSKLNFFHSDVLEYSYTKSDAFIISDVLHYLKEADQEILIRKCVDNLNDSGMLIIRDGNSELQERHKGTKLTEFFSTKVIGFNKVTIDKLCFTSKEKILEIVSGYPVTVEILDNTQYTSNIIFIIRKK